MSKILICDIDGTVAEESSNVAFDLENIKSTNVISNVATKVKEFQKQGFAVAFVTGRTQSIKQETKTWLENTFKFPFYLMCRTDSTDIKNTDTSKLKNAETVIRYIGGDIEKVVFIDNNKELLMKYVKYFLGYFNNKVILDAYYVENNGAFLHKLIYS